MKRIYISDNIIEGKYIIILRDDLIKFSKDGGIMMKIANYSISMASVREMEVSYTKTETLQQWRDSRPGSGGERSGNANARAGILDYLKKSLQDQLEISAQAKEALKQQQSQSTKNIGPNDDLNSLSDADERKLMILEKLLSALTGREIKIRLPKIHHPQTSGVNLPNCLKDINCPKDGASATPPRQGWGAIYQKQETYYESEKLSFGAQGVVKTADGKEIDFDVQLKMSREFAASNNISIKGGDAQLDPLVINFDGKAAGLTDTKYNFDLDANGTADQISFLREGSGFLALDTNNDGTVNNGTELFGPATGNGFQELAKFDADQNGWIDENDAIFDKLRIWTKDDKGNDQLFALGQKGIGAIFLGNIKAGFNLTNTENESLGVAQKAGVYLRENGAAGMIQQIDLTV
jgi:hypothetical protein